MREKMKETSLKRAKDVFALTKNGMSTTDACEKIGLAASYYYRLKSLNNLEDEVIFPTKRKIRKTASPIDIPIEHPSNHGKLMLVIGSISDIRSFIQEQGNV